MQSFFGKKLRDEQNLDSISQNKIFLMQKSNNTKKMSNAKKIIKK